MTSQQVPSQPFKWGHVELNDFQIDGQTTLFVIVAFFAVSLTAVFMVVYARWLYHSFLHVHTALGRRRGLDPATINNMPTVLYGSSGEFGEQGGECSICLGIFGSEEKVKVLPECGHCFHPQCVDKWLVTDASCPICRVVLRVDSPV